MPPAKKRSNSVIEDSDEELNEKPSKKSVKKGVKKEDTDEAVSAEADSSSAGKGVEIRENKDGDKFFEVGNKRSRRVTVSSFKNAPLIDIREFYTKEEQQLPGKKGVSLKPEEVSR